MNSSMSGKVTDAFRSSRSGAAPGRGKGKKAAGAAPPAAAAPANLQAPSAQEQQAEEDERFLRQFDLDSK